jgi:hypothetical protein
MAKKRAKTARRRTSATRKDLPLGSGKARGIRGGKAPIQLKAGTVLKTPAPAGPVPIPYPN